MDWGTPRFFSPIACIYYYPGSNTHAGRRCPCKKSLLLLPAFLFHLFSDSIFIPVTYLIMPGLYILLISLLTVMIWVLAPVGNAHKHYTTAERTKIKKILFFLLFFIYAFAVLMLSWKQQLYYHMILICLCIVLINQCIARCLNHRTLHVSKGEKK